jgi:phenylalanyl-tRNA synthetase beta chain
MEISYKWLQTFIELPEPPEEVGQRLTGTGLEVEGIERFDAVPGGLNGLVVGEVLTCTKHPDANSLSLTTVDAGDPEPLSIVCGAPNVAAGQKVIVAKVGATLYPIGGEPFTIKKAKIRGAASEGMLCAEDEIGLGQSHAGIIVLDTDGPASQLPNGTPAARYFNLEADYQIIIGLTPNRIDAASHLGTARDLHAVLNRPLRLPDVSPFAVDTTDFTLDVRVDDVDACPRYTGLTISGLTVSESPAWLKQRLQTIGINPINNVVDITNFVCHDLGQPLHAFDADKIAGNQVIVKTLPGRTPFVTLDGVVRSLTDTDLMICDADGPMCIAGVFGGKESGVTAQTTRIFLESAYFSASSIRKTAQHHRLKTDASFRFERGTDPDMPVFALKRAALLIQEIAGGQITSDITDLYPNPVDPFRVPVRYRNIDRLIGIQIAHDEIKRILSALNIEQTNETTDGFTAVVPPYRVDVTREADVIEEILRIYGLDNIPLSSNLSAESLTEFPKNDVNQWQNRVGQVLTAGGFYEILTLSLTRPNYHDAIRASLPGTDVTLLNPLSDELSVMRQSMLFSALETLTYNLNRRQKDLSLFEFGKVYSQTTTDDSTTKYIERMRLSMVMMGNQRAESWQHKSQPVAYSDLAAAVQRVLNLFRIGPDQDRRIETQSADPMLFQYGLTYLVNKKPVVSVGLVQPRLTKLVDLKQPVFYADFDWDYLMKLGSPKVRYQEVPRFPSVRRDLSLVLDKSVAFEQIDRLAHQTERKLLQAVNVFDVFEDDALGADRKAYSVSFMLQDPLQTLTDATIDKTMSRLMGSFERELGAVIRK